MRMRGSERILTAGLIVIALAAFVFSIIILLVG